MMSDELKKIDARGMSCPQSVLMTKKGVQESPAGVEVWVDDSTARGNVERFLRNLGYVVEVTEQGEEYLIVNTTRFPGPDCNL